MVGKWNDFIFSTKRADRVQRHITLWICFCVYFFFVNYFPMSWHDLVSSSAYEQAFQKLIYIPVSILSVYISAYFLLPHFFLKERYVAFIALILVLNCVNLVNAWLITRLLVMETTILPFNKMPILVRVYQPVIYGIGLGFTASGFAIIVKLLKHRYLKRKENERLQRQRIDTELKLIKTNFHPHFLSDSLRKISSLIRSSSSQSPKVILKLSDLLSYILYDSEKKQVSLAQEMQTIREYLELEKLFHRERITIKLEESGNADDIYIAPLILLSLVQNTCEQLLNAPDRELRLELKIKTESRRVLFEMICHGCHDEIDSFSNSLPGLDNALRRIGVLYGKESFTTRFEDAFFSVTVFIEDNLSSTYQMSVQEINSAHAVK
ncbi:MAG: sensor histidine kinase [Flavisolibacter sp.]